MKNLFIKILCLLIVASMVTFVFVGCDEEKTDADNADNGSVDAGDGTEELEQDDDSWTADEKVGEVADLSINAPRVLFVTDFHYCGSDQTTFYGIDKDQRMQCMIRDINAEHAKDPLEAIIFVGDSSLDHWESGGSWIGSNISYTRLFIQKYKAQMPTIPMYFAPGNHEQFTNEEWKSITGNERNTSVVIGDYLFLIWDAFAGDLGSNRHHHGTATPINSVWAKSVMDQNPGKKVVLVSHWITTTSSSIISDSRVVAMFVGHDHAANKTTVSGKTVIHCGNYSYYKSGSAVLDNLKECMWGFRDCYLLPDKLLTRYIVADNTIMTNTGTVYKSQYHYQNIYEISA